MQAPTHALFGLVFTIAAGTVLGLLLTPAVAAFVLLGALLPDLDTPTSLVGRLCRPLARGLERRLGHRTATHSLLGAAVGTAAVLPLAWVDPHWPFAFALGYLSHVLLDCVNPPGAPLFYPSPVRAVLPKREAWRIPEGAPAERVLLVALVVSLAVLLPLHQMGFTRALHRLTQTTGGAISDVRTWEGRYEVWVDVEGTFRLSQRRVRQRYRVLGVANASTLVVLDPTSGDVHSVGAGEGVNIHPAAIWAAPGRPITVRSQQLVLTQRLLRDLLREIPGHEEVYLHGILRTPDTPVIRPDPEQYDTLKPGLHALELRFARPRDLDDPAVATLFVLSGLVLVQTVVPTAPGPPPAGAPAPPPTPEPEFDDVTELFIAQLTDPGRELRVREGERVHRGQLLARITTKDAELDRRRQHGQAQLSEAEAALAGQEEKARQARALVAAGLAAPAAAARETAARLQAQEAVAQARRELERLAEEARRVTEIRSPVDGQILTIRVHVVHGSESTAVLRLLYRKAPTPT